MCDYRCLLCKDSSNLNCDLCAPGAFRYLGSLCVNYCPPDYIGDTKSGICIKRGKLANLSLCNKTHACTIEEVCFNAKC